MSSRRGQRPRVVPALKLVAGLLSVLMIQACSTGPDLNCRDGRQNPCIPTEVDKPHKKISDYGFFRGAVNELRAIEELVPYDLNTPLFSDYAAKYRLLYVPDGKSVDYTEGKVLEFPVGSVLIKNFFYESEEGQKTTRNLLESRLLLHHEEGWSAETYVWNERQTEAFRKIAGDRKEIDWTDREGIRRKFEYLIPNKNDCKTCHSNNGRLLPLGPRVDNLNKTYSYSDGPENQLRRWKDRGLFAGNPLPGDLPKAPVWNDPSTGAIHERARIYLDINCSSCHSRAGSARHAGLFLSHEEEDPFRVGVCKPPISIGPASGGLKYGIVPCRPEESILLYRMKAVEPGKRMPEIGRTLVHDEAVALIKTWIESMECDSCD